MVMALVTHLGGETPACFVEKFTRSHIRSTVVCGALALSQGKPTRFRELLQILLQQFHSFVYFVPRVVKSRLDTKVSRYEQ